MKLTARPSRMNVEGRTFSLSRGPEGAMVMEAGDELALASACGAAHAVDRALQALLRLIGQGRLSESLQADDETLGVDRFAREMGPYRARRIRMVLAEKPRCTPEDLQRLQVELYYKVLKPQRRFGNFEPPRRQDAKIGQEGG